MSADPEGTEEAVHQGKVLSSANTDSGSFPTFTTTIPDSGCTLPRGRLPPRAGATFMIPRKVLGYHSALSFRAARLHARAL